MFPTWPAKSELGHKGIKKNASPKAPEGGGQSNALMVKYFILIHYWLTDDWLTRKERKSSLLVDTDIFFTNHLMNILASLTNWLTDWLSKNGKTFLYFDTDISFAKTFHIDFIHNNISYWLILLTD